MIVERATTRRTTPIRETTTPSEETEDADTTDNTGSSNVHSVNSTRVQNLLQKLAHDAKRSSRDEQLRALNVLAEAVYQSHHDENHNIVNNASPIVRKENDDDDIKTYVATYLIQNVALGREGLAEEYEGIVVVVEEVLLACLTQSCGTIASLLAAIHTLRKVASTADNSCDTSRIVATALGVLYNILCVPPTSIEDTIWITRIADDNDDGTTGSNNNRDEQTIVVEEEQDMVKIHSWIDLVLTLPSLVANASCCGRAGASASSMNILRHNKRGNELPLWAVRDKYRPQLVTCACSSLLLLLLMSSNSGTEEEGRDVSSRETMREKEEAITLQDIALCQRYVHTLIHTMIRHGATDHVVLGLFQQYQQIASSSGDRGSSFSSSHRRDKKQQQLRHFENLILDLYLSRQLLNPRDAASLCRATILHILSIDKKETNDTGKMDFDSLWIHPWLQIACLPALRTCSRDIRDTIVRLSILSPSYKVAGQIERHFCHALASLLAKIGVIGGNNKKCQQSDDDDFSSDSDQEDDDSGELRRQLNKVSSIWSQALFVRSADTKFQHHVTLFLLSGLALLPNDHENASSALVQNVLEGVTQRLGSSIDVVRKDGMRVAMKLADRLGQELEFDELDVSDDERHDLVFPSASDDSFHHAPRLIDHDDDSILGDDEGVSAYDLNDDEDDLLETPRPLYLVECLDLLRTPESEDHAHSRH